nr:LuxR C-terminal-related transcriptional regulator [Microvirga zambiensis]
MPARSGDEQPSSGSAAPRGRKDPSTSGIWRRRRFRERRLPSLRTRERHEQREALSTHQEQQRQVADAGPKVLDDRIKKLSPREADVLRGIMNREPNKVIARQFDVTESTVKVHVKSILRKIGAANRTQAAMWASDRMTPVPRAHLDS